MKTAKLIVVAAAVLMLGAVAFNFYDKNNGSELPNSQQTNELPDFKENKTGKLRTFTGQDFVNFYYNFAFPNTQQINEEAPITGNEKADEHIKRLAESRGYRVQSAPVADVLVEVETKMFLQPKAAIGWKELKAAARSDGINLGLSAGFRSEKEQLSIFLERLNRNNVQVSQIPAGAFDAQINQTLVTTALPGYSKHHNGYTVDIICPDDPAVVFEGSVCFRWLSKQNYKNAKTHGWVPSYPDGAKKQGPDPEAWEYVWVGKEALLD